MPDAAVLGQAADHVEDDSLLAGLVEVQPVPGHDVEQVRRREAAEHRGLEVVRRHQVLLVTPRRGEERGGGVVTTIGQELQGEERMGRAALAQVELDGVRRP